MNLKFWRCRPKIITIQEDRTKGDTVIWVWSPREFDQFFAGAHVFRENGVVWGIAQLSPMEAVKVYRGTPK